MMKRHGRLTAQLILGALLLHLVLIQPNHPAASTWGALFVFPLELPVVLLILVALGQGIAGKLVRGVLVTALVVIATLKSADFAMFTALSRGFNPVADAPLIAASVRLLAGSIGPFAALAAVLGVVMVIIALTAALYWATGVWSRLPRTRWMAGAAAVSASLAAGVAVAEIGDAMGRWTLPVEPPGAAFTARVGVERVGQVSRTLDELRTFRTAAATDPFVGQDGLLSAIDRDVLILFVESYGRASFDTPFHALIHQPTLARAEARLTDAGLAMRSGFMAAPTRGGQSWLSHATFANGLWIDNQSSYGAALASGRQTLFHIAAGSGFRTAAVMPAITLDWPEALFMGFDTILAADDLGYAGEPFNWVTMPDQFTLAALDRLLLHDPAAPPLFAQVALISSHAPWVPVPTLRPWEDIGNGRIFDSEALAGDPPEVVWRDRDRVRAQYRAAIDYALQVVFDYAERHAANPPLIMVIGDHQAAGFVALDNSPDVPVHLIGPADLVDRAAAWGWKKGLVPDGETPVAGMDAMRDMVLRSFSAEQTAEDAGG